MMVFSCWACLIRYEHSCIAAEIIYLSDMYFLLKCKASNGYDEAQLMNAVRDFVVPRCRA